MNNDEQTIVEEIRSYLGLGDPKVRKDDQRLSLGSEHIRSYIEDAFRLKSTKLDHHDSISTAFTKSHHNMYIDDPAFHTVFKKEMTGRGIPEPEIEEALDIVDSVLDKMSKEFGTKQEKDGGIHPKIDEIEEVSKPSQPENGELLKPRKGHTQKNNIDSDLPINREKHKERQKPVMEDNHKSITEGTPNAIDEILLRLQTNDSLLQQWLNRPDSKKVLGNIPTNLFVQLRIIVQYLKNPRDEKYRNTTTRDVLERYKTIREYLEHIIKSGLTGGIVTLTKKMLPILDGAFNNLATATS